MRILIVSTLKRKVTPEETASRSQIIYQLADGLAKKGHEVSLIGTKNSFVPGVKIIPVTEKGWIGLPPVENAFFREIATMIQLVKKVVEIQDQFDIIHNHLYPEFFTSLIENDLKIPLITTVHIQHENYVDETMALFKKTKFISISKAHRSLFLKTPIHKIVYNGIDTNLFSFQEKKEDYLLWIGRLSKAKKADGSYLDLKGVRWAIKLAQESDSKLVLTGNVEDMGFYNKDVKPYLTDKITWYGPVSNKQELDHSEIVKLMQKAKTFLMTVNWNEPFGLVMAEAQSCGTPVIGFNRGAVPELVSDGKTGFVVEPSQSILGLKEALKKIDQIKPENCRKHIEENFSIEKMVANYEQTYSELLVK